MGSSIKTAMIIDDDEDLTHILAQMLEKRKIHAMEVHTLSEAEDCLTYMKPSIIFLDNNFPEGLGINFIRSIRSSDDNIKIIMMTADTSRWVEQKAKDEGVNFFLKKPLSANVIDMALDELNFKKSS